MSQDVDTPSWRGLYVCSSARNNSVAKNLLVSKGQLKECKLMSSTARTPVQEYTEVRSEKQNVGRTQETFSEKN